MSAAHTEGLLSRAESGGVVNAKGEVVIPYLYTDFTDEDLRRVVACWNACEGMNITFIENAAPLNKRIRDTDANVVRLAKELVAARALLAEVANDSATTNHMLERIETFLKGGAA